MYLGKLITISYRHKNTWINEKYDEREEIFDRLVVIFESMKKKNSFSIISNT